jgi:hypothetical protein
MESQGQVVHSAPMQAPAMGGQPQPIEWGQPPEGPGGTNKTLMIVAGAALVIAAVGMVRSMMSPKEASAEPVAAAPTYFSEQAKMMREAMTMAKEAQAMQREHMQMVQDQMRMCEEGYAGEQTATNGLYEELNGGYGVR